MGTGSGVRDTARRLRLRHHTNAGCCVLVPRLSVVSPSKSEVSLAQKVPFDPPRAHLCRRAWMTSAQLNFNWLLGRNFSSLRNPARDCFHPSGVKVSWHLPKSETESYEPVHIPRNHIGKILPPLLMEDDKSFCLGQLMRPPFFAL